MNMNITNRTKIDIPKIWNSINGLVNIYKPTGFSSVQTKYNILNKICQDLNQLNTGNEIKPNIRITSTFGSKLSINYENVCSTSAAIGDIYEVKNFQHKLLPKLGNRTSGVLVLGLNHGVKQLNKINIKRPIAVYHVTGTLGTATENNFNDSRVNHRANYKHITVNKISDLVSSLQAAHQRKIYDICGIDIQSQTAYELAAKGLIKPVNYDLPLLYGIKCINYKSPNFILEIHCLNENESYFGILVHEIGLQLHTVAHCANIKCIRYGSFSIHDSLLKKDWNLGNILSSMNNYSKI